MLPEKICKRLSNLVNRRLTPFPLRYDQGPFQRFHDETHRQPLFQELRHHVQVLPDVQKEFSVPRTQVVKPRLVIVRGRKAVLGAPAPAGGKPAGKKSPKPRKPK